MKQQPPLINIFLSCRATVQLSLARVTALGKIILRLLAMMGGVCYCAGLNGDPNDVMHYSTERVCRIFAGLKGAFPQALEPAL